MSEKGLTTIALKKINRSKIYQYIYRSKLTSKLQIVQDLQMGLSTVSQKDVYKRQGILLPGAVIFNIGVFFFQGSVTHF